MNRIAMTTFASGLVACVLTLAMPVYAAQNPQQNLNSMLHYKHGTLTYKIVFTGHGVTRSAKDNAGTGYSRLLHAALAGQPVPANTVSIHEVVTGTTQMRGLPAGKDSLATAAQAQKQQDEAKEKYKKTLQEGQSMNNLAQAVMKAQQKCHGDTACIMAANKRVVAKLSPQSRKGLENGTPGTDEMTMAKQKEHRFTEWKQYGRCGAEAVHASKAKGLSLTSAGGEASYEYYHAHLDGRTKIKCQGSSASLAFSSTAALVFDTWNGNYELRIAGLEFSGTLPYRSSGAFSNVDNKLSTWKDSKSHVGYSMSAPAIVIHDLHGATPLHKLSGKKTVNVHFSFAGYDTADPGFISFSGPVKAVVTWTFTLDQQ